MKKKKLFFVMLDLNMGGAQKTMLTLISFLDREKFEPTLIVMKRTGVHAADIPADVPVLELKRQRFAIPRFLYFAWRDRPGAIFCALLPFNVMVLALKPFLPAGKIFINEVTVLSEKLIQSYSRPALWKALIKYFYRRRADLIICCSRFVRDDLLNNFSVAKEKLTYVYNPIPITRIKKLAAEDNPYSTAGPNVLAAGRLVYLKGFDRLIDAFSQVKTTFPAARLTILGEGLLEQELKAQCRELGIEDSVDFAGFKANPYPYYKNADLFVACSRYEGLSNVLLEAMVCGCQVIAVDSPGGYREIFEITGKTDRIVKKENLALAITAALSQDSLVRKGLSYKGLERFDAANVTNEYSAYLEKVGG